jgi:hypothetical protein
VNVNMVSWIVGGTWVAFWLAWAICAMVWRRRPTFVLGGRKRCAGGDRGIGPIYTGLSVILIGTALVYPSAVALPCALMIAYSVFSARREERDMEQRFPSTYAEYKQHSKFLVPFLF